MHARDAMDTNIAYGISIATESEKLKYEAMRRLSELLTKLGMPQRAAALQQKANEISPEPKPIPKPKAADTRKKGPASKALPSMEGLGDQFKSLINKILKRG